MVWSIWWINHSLSVDLNQRHFSVAKFRLCFSDFTLFISSSPTAFFFASLLVFGLFSFVSPFVILISSSSCFHFPAAWRLNSPQGFCFISQTQFAISWLMDLDGARLIFYSDVQVPEILRNKLITMSLSRFCFAEALKGFKVERCVTWILHDWRMLYWESRRTCDVTQRGNTTRLIPLQTYNMLFISHEQVWNQLQPESRHLQDNVSALLEDN